MDEGLRKRLQWPDCRDNYRVIGFAALLPIAGIAAMVHSVWACSKG